MTSRYRGRGGMPGQPPIQLKTCRLSEETSFPHVSGSDGNEFKMQGLRETSFFGFCAPVARLPLPSLWASSRVLGIGLPFRPACRRQARPPPLPPRRRISENSGLVKALSRAADPEPVEWVNPSRTPIKQRPRGGPNQDTTCSHGSLIQALLITG